MMIQNHKRLGGGGGGELYDITLLLTRDTKIMVWLLNPYGLNFYSLIPSDLTLEWN